MITGWWLSTYTPQNRNSAAYMPKLASVCASMSRGGHAADHGHVLAPQDLEFLRCNPPATPGPIYRPARNRYWAVTLDNNVA